MNNYSYKQIILISLPVMLSVLMEQLINITDAIFLGRVGEVEVGAAGLAGTYYLALYMLGFGFCVGLQVLIARYNGKGRYRLTGRTLFQGLWFLLALAAVIIILSDIFTSGLLKFVISSNDILEAAQTYIKWRSRGLLFAFPALALRSFFVGVVRTKVMTWNALAMVTANIMLNYLLIYGHAGFPRMGIKGAAIASGLSEMVSLIVYAIYLLRNMDRKKYGLLPIFDRKLTVRLCKLSLWSMFNSFIGVAPWFLFFIAVEHLGEMQLAIANITRSVSAFFSVIVNALAATTSSLVSNIIGENGNNPRNEVMELCSKMLRVGYAIGTPLIVLALIFNHQVLGIYSTNPLLINNAFWPYIVGISVFFPGLPGFIYLNAVSGTGNTRMAFAFQMVTIILYMIYLWILSSFLDAPLAVYSAIEHLFVISLLIMSCSYMKKWSKAVIGKE